VAREQHDFDEQERTGPRALEEDGADDLDDLDEDDELVAQDGAAEGEGAGVALDDEDGSEQASLEELFARRAAFDAGDDSGEDADITELSSEVAAPVIERTRAVVTPVRERQEFVCKSCHLVKPRVQLGDGRRGLCRDCG